MSRRGTAASPIIAGLAVTAIWCAAIVAAASWLPHGSPVWLPDLRSILVNVIALGVPLAVTVRNGWWRQVWLRSWRPRRSWLLLGPLAVLAVSPALPDGLHSGGSVILSGAALFLVLAVNEEWLSRGVVQHICSPLSPLAGVAAVAVLFGLSHAVNFVISATAPGQTALQIISATAYGAAFAAARRRIKSLAPFVALHPVEDFLGALAVSADRPLLNLTEAILDLSYAAVLLAAETRSAPSGRSPSREDKPKPT